MTSVRAMPLGEAALALLSVALRDAQVVTRYRDKIAAVPGSDCLYWCHAISGRGHGRFYVGTLPAGQGGRQRDLCMIAHRFGYALVYGADALQQVPVLGHGCDNPLCQRIGPGHVQPSSHAQNRRAYLARRFVAGSPLGDARGAGAGRGSCVTYPGLSPQPWPLSRSGCCAWVCNWPCSRRDRRSAGPSRLSR